MLEEINTNDSCNNKRYEKQECITDNDFLMFDTEKQEKTWLLLLF